MVKADIPSHSRDSSPDKVSTGSGGSEVSLVSRTNSSASYSPDISTTLSTTRESSPDYRSDQTPSNVDWRAISGSVTLEISMPESGQTNVRTTAGLENNQEKTPIAADSPLLTQVG